MRSMVLLRALAFALPLTLLAAASAQAEGFCSCATDSGTSVGSYKNAECTTLGVPKMAGEDLDCDDAESVYYGSPYSGTNTLTDGGGSGCRGAASLLGDRYGGTAAGCGWSAGQPASPTYGSSCANPAGPCGGECEPAVWLDGDPLQAPSNYCWAMLTANVSDDLFDGATQPSAPLAGSRSLALVVHPQETNGLWNSGTAPFSFQTHTYALSKLLAFPSNIASSGVLYRPWKGDQCGLSNHCMDTWLGEDSGASTDNFPFVGMSIYTLSNCSGAVSGATYVVGSSISLSCNGSQVRLVSPSNYLRPTDFPYGQVGLVQVFYKGFGTSSMEWAVYFTPLGGSRKTLFHVQNFNSTGATSPSPYNPNAYSNANQVDVFGDSCTDRGDCTTLDTGRVWDNFLIQSWSSGTSPADVLAAMPTPTQMQLTASESPTFTTASASASPSSGAAPLNDVDFTIGTLGGSATGDVSLSVDCTTNGSFDASFADSAAAWTIADACDYAAAGSYTATVRATREGVTASPDLTVGVTVSAAPPPPAPPPPRAGVSAGDLDGPLRGPVRFLSPGAWR